MISLRQHGAAVIAVILGEFQLADFRELEVQVDACFAKPGAGPVDVLIDLRDMVNFTLDVAWEELRYTRRHSHDFGRIAVVTDTEWSIWSSWIARAFVDARFLIFDSYEEAEAWLEVESDQPHRTLVSSARLDAHLGDWVAFDCRHNLADLEAGRKGYEAGHIPGAHFLNLDFDLAAPPSPASGRHPLPDPEALAQRLGALGVGQDTQVVAYDDAGGPFAARLWWLLRWMGHDAVAVLDGGIQQWVAEGHALEPGPDPLRASLADALPAGDIPPGLPIVLQHDTWVSAGTVEDRLTSGSLLIVDARSPDRFRGENETLDPVGGHIPGAINRFYRNNLAADGRFKAPDVLRAEFLALLNGRSPSTVVSQCGSGVTACHNLLALEIAGLSGAKLYPGSWSEWCADPKRPVAR